MSAAIQHDEMKTRSKRQRFTSTSTRLAAARQQPAATNRVPTAVSFSSLPFDVVANILSLLNAQDLLHCMLVNRWWKQQIYTTSIVSLQHTVFRWTQAGMLTQPAEQQAISLPHVRRLHVSLPQLQQPSRLGKVPTIATDCHPLQHVLNDINASFQQLAELIIVSSNEGSFPDKLQRAVHSLQKLYMRAIRIRHNDITTIAAAYPNLTSLKLSIPVCRVSPDLLCSNIGRLLVSLQTLMLPQLGDSEEYFDSDITQLAPLTDLRRLHVPAYGSTKFTFADTWTRLECLAVSKHGRYNKHEESQLVLRGQASSLQTFFTDLPSLSPGGDALLESLIKTGAAKGLRRLEWLTDLPVRNKAVQHLSEFRALKRLTLWHMNAQLVCTVLRELQCALNHLQLPASVGGVDDIHACFRALTESAAVQQCHTIGLPWMKSINDQEWQRLVQKLPHLRKVLLYDSNQHRTDLAAHLSAIAGRDIEIALSRSIRDVIDAAVTEAFE